MSILPQQPYVSIITPSQGDRQDYLRQCGDSIDMIRDCGIPLDWIIASPVAPDVTAKHTPVPLERVVSPGMLPLVRLLPPGLPTLMTMIFSLQDLLQP